VTTAVVHPGKPITVDTTFDLAEIGYVEVEYLLSGTAESFRTGGAGVEVAGKAEFVTRVIVRRPLEPARFSGTVLLEWFNVSSGVDLGPDWTILHAEMARRGDAYVGVSAQQEGIDGGIRNGPFLKQQDPGRYGALKHPGDAYCYGIFTAAARHVRQPDGGGLLPGMRPTVILAAGESQSAAFLGTYINEIDRVTQAFDGYFVHSWVGLAPPLEGVRDEAMRQAAYADPDAFGDDHRTFKPEPRVPVMRVQSDTDLYLMGNDKGRQPDTDRVRTWEIAGIAHGDPYMLNGGRIDNGRLTPEERVAAFTDAPGRAEMNSLPAHHYVGKAAYAHLCSWVTGGDAPPTGERVVFVDKQAGFEEDETGNVVGGIRSPWLEVPVCRYSALSSDGQLKGLGCTQPLDPELVAKRYTGGIEDYLAQFSASLDATIAAGFILPVDRDEILGFAPALYDRWVSP
jgi:hypothetical protein